MRWWWHAAMGWTRAALPRCVWGGLWVGGREREGWLCVFLCDR